MHIIMCESFWQRILSPGNMFVFFLAYAGGSFHLNEHIWAWISLY